jgi:hypothetical protein
MLCPQSARTSDYTARAAERRRLAGRPSVISDLLVNIPEVCLFVCLRRLAAACLPGAVWLLEIPTDLLLALAVTSSNLDFLSNHWKMRAESMFRIETNK